LERNTQPEGYVFSIALRYEFPLLITYSSKKFLSYPRRQVREWMDKYAFFSEIQNNIFSVEPYHYCALVSDCEDGYQSVANRYSELSHLSPKELSDEHARVFHYKPPEDYHITIKEELLNHQKDYALLSILTPKLWHEVLGNEWKRLMLPVIGAKTVEMCSALTKYPIKEFVEEYARLSLRTNIFVHPSWTQNGAAVFEEQGTPSIVVGTHEEVGIWLVDLFVHESVHCLCDQERLFQDKTIQDKTIMEPVIRICKKLEDRGVEVRPGYELGLNYVMEAFTEALTLRVINLNIDQSFKVEKFAILQPILYKALIDLHEKTKRTLSETLPDILRWSSTCI
jgi:hypothetical protein